MGYTKKGLAGYFPRFLFSALVPSVLCGALFVAGTSDVWAARSVAENTVSSAIDLSAESARPADLSFYERSQIFQPGRVISADPLQKEARAPVRWLPRDESGEIQAPVTVIEGDPAPVRSEPLEKEGGDQAESERCDPLASFEALAPALLVDDGAAAPSLPDDEQPVDLAADTLIHDEESQIITARGHVELVQGARLLRADEVSYNLATDTVEATGHVALTEPNGDVHFADHVTLSDNMRRGFVVGLQSYLTDGGRFWAGEGERTAGGRVIVMRDAAYTPCNCGADKSTGPDDKAADPTWQIKAKSVTYNEEDHRISYRHARFEVLGVPVLYTPYLSHPDGKEEQKSGFLMPNFALDSELGAMITNRYYWAMAPHRDATFGLMTGTRENPVVLGQYRQRFADASLTLDASVTRSGWTDSVGGEELWHDEAWRGHLFTQGRWDINETWRAGADLEMTSDDQYLEQYNFTGKDVLENDVYLERFSDRNYATARFLSFQDLRVREEQTDQPNVLPELYASFIGAPNALLGGRWSLALDGLNLYREGNEQDMSRGTATLGWENRHVTGFGLVNTLDLSARGDMYHVTDRALAANNTGLSRETTQGRMFAQAHLVSSYPLVKPIENGQIMIEPLVSGTVAPNIDSVDDDIPNEDSQDVQLDASNLFEPDRFPGQDRIEDGSRVTYGVRTGLYGDGGGRIEAFAGQSYRLNNDKNRFPEGSGLSRRESDLVGSVSAAYKDRMALDYHFQLDAAQWDAQRHELDAFAERGPFRLDTRYLFAKALEGTDIDESREQLMGALSVDLWDNWQARGGALYDLGEDPGLRKAMLGLDYTGCCMFLSIAAERSLTRDSSGDSGTDIMLRLGLKHIGSFETSAGSDWRAGNAR